MTTTHPLTDGVTSLRRLREAADLTQQEVADAVNRHTGHHNYGPVTAGQVSRWERGHGISRRYRQALAAVFDTTVDALNVPRRAYPSRSAGMPIAGAELARVRRWADQVAELAAEIGRRVAQMEDVDKGATA